jgi:hypothetical protein
MNNNVYLYVIPLIILFMVVYILVNLHSYVMFAIELLRNIVKKTNEYYKNKCADKSSGKTLCLFLYFPLFAYIEKNMDYITEIDKELRNLSSYILSSLMLVIAFTLFMLYLIIVIVKNDVNRLAIIIFCICILTELSSIILLSLTFNVVNPKIRNILSICSSNLNNDNVDSVIYGVIPCLYFGSMLTEFNTRYISLLFINPACLLSFIIVSIVIFVAARQKRKSKEY